MGDPNAHEVNHFALVRVSVSGSALPYQLQLSAVEVVAHRSNWPSRVDFGRTALNADECCMSRVGNRLCTRLQYAATEIGYVSTTTISLLMIETSPPRM